MTHFNPVTGQLQERSWTEDRPDEPVSATDDPRENHSLQFRGRADGQLDVYCRNPECLYRRVVEADRDVKFLLILDMLHREGNDDHD